MNGSAPNYEERHVLDRTVRISPDRGAPLLLLVRLLPYNMGIWDNIWNELAADFTVATFNLRVPNFSAETDPRAVFHSLAEDCVRIAKALGRERFHIFGWHGGAQVALRAAIDFPERIFAAMLQGAIYEHREGRPADFAMKMVEAVVAENDLEFLTMYVVLTGVSPEFAETHFKQLEDLVARRVEVDRGRLDAVRAYEWGRLQRRYHVTESELDRVTAPVLLVAPLAGVWPPYHLVRRLYERLPGAELATIARGGDFVVYEDPDAFFAATARFLRAAARGSLGALAPAGHDVAVTAGGLRAAVNEAGPEHTVVFLHGWLMSPQIWEAALERLGSRARCIALWQPAHGPSAAPPDGFSMDDWVRWTLDALDALGVRRATFVGHSMGGMLAQALRERAPERVAALVLVGTQAEAWDDEIKSAFNSLAASVAGWDGAVSDACADLLIGKRYFENNGTRAEWQRGVEARHDLAAMARLAPAISNRPDFVAGHARSAIPVLVVHGGDDAAIDVERGRSLARHAAAEYVEYAGCGHCPPLEVPDEFAQTLERFLSAHGLIGS